MITTQLKKYQSYNYYHYEWVKRHKVKNQYIDFDKSYVRITRIANYDKINPQNPLSWISVPYKLFFDCKCPNLKGNGTNHSLENCRHYQRSQFKKLQSGQIISKNTKGYNRKYYDLKRKYKPIDYDIFFYIKRLPHPVKTR